MLLSSEFDQKFSYKQISIDIGLLLIIWWLTSIISISNHILKWRILLGFIWWVALFCFSLEILVCLFAYYLFGWWLVVCFPLLWFVAFVLSGFVHFINLFVISHFVFTFQAIKNMSFIKTCQLILWWVVVCLNARVCWKIFCLSYWLCFEMQYFRIYCCWSKEFCFKLSYSLIVCCLSQFKTTILSI